MIIPGKRVVAGTVAAALLAGGVSCSPADPVPGIRKKVVSALDATRAGGGVQARLDVEVVALNTTTFTGTTTEGFGTATGAQLSFAGTSEYPVNMRMQTRNLRVVTTAGRAYDSLNDGHTWNAVNSTDDLVHITGVPGVDLGLLDPQLYLNVVAQSVEGQYPLDIPHDLGDTSVAGVPMHHYLTNCTPSLPSPTCSPQKLGSLFTTFHDDASTAPVHVWVDKQNHIRRLQLLWDLTDGIALLRVKATVDFTGFTAPAPIVEPTRPA